MTGASAVAMYGYLGKCLSVCIDHFQAIAAVSDFLRTKHAGNTASSHQIQCHGIVLNTVGQNQPCNFCRIIMTASIFKYPLLISTLGVIRWAV